MQIKRKPWIGAATVLLLALTGLTPTQAATTPVTLGNNNCDFAAVGQGHGSVSDPYLINAPIDLQELNECQSRQKSILNAVVNNDGTVTFTVDAMHGALGAGQVVTISNTDNGVLNAENVKVVSATETTVTVKMAATAGDTTGNGQIDAQFNHVKLNANLDLGAASTETWNNNSAATITAAAKNNDGTVTFTAANSFQVGDYVYIDGMGDSAFNIGGHSIQSATSTEFVTDSSSVNLADGSIATSAGGKAHAVGWVPVALNRTEFDGAGHTITGVKIYRHGGDLGLFGYSQNAIIKNLTVTNSTVNTTSLNSNDSVYNTGVVAGRMDAVILNNVSVTGSTVVAGGSYAGLVTGRLENSSATGVTVAGTVTGGLTSHNPGSWINFNAYGGVAGQAYNVTMSQITSSATVNGSATSQDANSASLPAVTTYFESIGGIVGYASEFTARNLAATGDVTGRYYVGGAFGQMNWDGELVNASATGNVIGTVGALQNNDVRYIGGFAGRLLGESDNQNISASGNVTVNIPADNSQGTGQIGGLTGYANCCGSNNNLSSTGTVTVNMLGTGEVYSVGGLMGENDCCQIVSNSNSSSNVVINTVTSNVYNVGGFVGEWNCCGVDRQNSSSGNVTVTISDPNSGWAYAVGGYAGMVDCCGTLNNLEVSGNVTVNKGYKIGGFAGEGRSNMTYRDIKVTGNVTVGYSTPDELQWNASGNANVGGFIGWQRGRTAIERVNVTNNVTVTSVNSSAVRNVGGFIGGIEDSNGTIEILNSFYKGSVSGENYVGGLIGWGSKSPVYRLEGNLVVASVTATGTNAVSDPVMNSYFVDSSKSNFVDSTVAGKSVNAPEFNAATTANLKLEATYTAKGWTFTGNSPWRIDATTNGGYPYLVIPANDDSRTTGGTKTVEKVVTKTIVYKTVKSIAFSKKTTSLTSSQKKLLAAAAKVIAKSTYTSFVVSASPKASDLALTATRAAKVQAYLMAELKKLKSKKVVTISLTPKTSKYSTAIVVQQGK